LTVKSEIKRAQKKHQDNWFEDYFLSSIVIQKGRDQYNKIDLSDTRRILLRDIIKYRSLPLLQEYNFQNHNYYEKTNLPMLVGVVDSANDYPHFMNFFFLLEKIAIEYIDRVHFTWVDGVFNKNKKKMLGIEHDKLPTMAFNLILDPKNNTLAYPEKWVLSADKISQFVNDYITYSLYDLKILYGKEKQAQKSAIYNFFTNVQEFGLNNLTSTLTKKKNTDYVLFIFNSQNKIPDLESHVKSFNHIARRFQQLQIKKVEFGVYDTFYFQLPEDYDYLKTPIIAVISAKRRENPVQILINTEIEKMMLMIRKSSSTEFYLPEYPHVQEEDLGKFYNQMMINSGKIPEAKLFIL